MSQTPMPPSGPRPAPINPTPVDFGPNVTIFDPGMNMADIQANTDGVFLQQDGDANQFGQGRHAYLFKRGFYNVNVRISYYTTVHGLGIRIDDVEIIGGVQRLAASTKGNALNNFWSGVENLTVTPTAATLNRGVWAVSQATFLRRFHAKGDFFLFDPNGYPPPSNNWSSGGFVADSGFDTIISSGSQQQFLTRNSVLTNWTDPGVWNMVFVGDEQPPTGQWPASPFTVVDQTPLVREKPYLAIDTSGAWVVQVPPLRKTSQGTSWGTTWVNAKSLPISGFYIAQAGLGKDTADTLNDALLKGYNLILTPGIYHLSNSLQVTWPDTVILGLGMATLVPDKGTPALTIADVDGVAVSGIIIDAGPVMSSSLVLVGTATSSVSHAADPIALFDISCRVGGATAGRTQCCLTVNANDVILDNVWLWRADHGLPGTVGWTINPAQNGLIVNGQNLTAYGLFVEHFQGVQTAFNANGSSVYMYQSEIPYDVPSQAAWHQNGTNEKGFPSYKVAAGVTKHTGQGIGIYCNFNTPSVQLDNAIETPPTGTGSGIQMHHLVTRWLNGQPGTSINNIINNTGGLVANSTAMSPD